MRASLLLVLLLLLPVSVTGCSLTSAEGVAEGGLEYTDVTADLPAEVASWVEENKSRVFTGTKTVGDREYILISGGERPTAGYGIKIYAISGGESGKHVVTGELVEPEKGSMVAQVISYPHVVLEIPATDLPFEFRIANLD